MQVDAEVPSGPQLFYEAYVTICQFDSVLDPASARGWIISKDSDRKVACGTSCRMSRQGISTIMCVCDTLVKIAAVAISLSTFPCYPFSQRVSLSLSMLPGDPHCLALCRCGQQSWPELALSLCWSWFAHGTKQLLITGLATLITIELTYWWPVGKNISRCISPAIGS